MFVMRILKSISPVIICLFTVVLIVVLLTACNTLGLAPKKAKPPLEVSAPAFEGGSTIPVKYTCDGEDISPELNWKRAYSSRTKSFAVVVFGLDVVSGLSYHWLVYNIPPEINRFPEGISGQELTAMGATQLKNSFGKTGYSGPCPPEDSKHHYLFRVYRIDRILDLPVDATISQLLEAIEDHGTALGSTSGTYRRQ